MNCTVCGNPLIYDRAVFHCSCGAFVHAYCWDEHVLHAHRPSFEMGSVNLDGEFQAKESGKDEQVLRMEVSDQENSKEQEAPLQE